MVTGDHKSDEGHYRLQSLTNELSGSKAVSKETFTGIDGKLKTELGENLQYVDIVFSPNDIRIKPKKFLGSARALFFYI